MGLKSPWRAVRLSSLPISSDALQAPAGYPPIAYSRLSQPGESATGRGRSGRERAIRLSDHRRFAVSRTNRLFMHEQGWACTPALPGQGPGGVVGGYEVLGCDL